MSTSISAQRQSPATPAALRVVAPAVACGTALAAIASFTDSSESDPVRRTVVCLVLVAMVAAAAASLAPRLARRRGPAPVALGLGVLAVLIAVPAFWAGLPAALAVPALWVGRGLPGGRARAARGLAGLSLLGSLALVLLVR